MITGETLIKGLFYFLIKGKEGGKYLSRKRVTGKNGKQKWLYDYGKKGKKEKVAKEPEKKQVSNVSENEEVANIQMDRNELHRDFSSVKNYLESNRFAGRNYRLENELEKQLGKVRELSQNIKDKRSLTNLKKQFAKRKELSKQYSDLKTKHEESLEQEKKEADEKESQKQANKGELDKVAKVEYDKLLKTPKILNPILKVIKSNKVYNSFGVIHVKPDGYYATDGRIMIYNKANTGVSENRSITPKGQSGDPDDMKEMVNNGMPRVVEMGISHAKIPVKLDVKKLQAKLKESKAPYVIMKLGDSEVQLKKQLLNTILDAAKGWNKPVVLSHDDSSNNPLMLHIEGTPGKDSFGLIMPMKYDDMWTHDDKNQYQDLTGFFDNMPVTEKEYFDTSNQKEEDVF